LKENDFQDISHHEEGPSPSPSIVPFVQSDTYCDAKKNILKKLPLFESILQGEFRQA